MVLAKYAKMIELPGILDVIKHFPYEGCSSEDEDDEN